MELGKKLLQARIEAGISQRQLCGDQITRNMLSRIEHGTARPSMDTLRYLAGQLGKSVSYFLEEDPVTSPNQQVMLDARTAYDHGLFDGALQALEAYRSPDDIFDHERQLLETLSLLALAEKAIAQRRFPYAKELLGRVVTDLLYRIPGLERRRLLLLGQIPGEDLTAVCQGLPDMDEELLLRAEAALAQKNHGRAGELLAAAENKASPRWNLLRGKALFGQQHYSAAADCLRFAEAEYPRECWPMLEDCCRELGDFQQAYIYACKQK